LQRKFQLWRHLDDLDEKDGEVMGKMLMANSCGLLSKNRTKKAKEERVANFFEEFRAMKEGKVDLPFLETLIGVVVAESENERDYLVPHTVPPKLELLTVEDGGYLGCSFLSLLYVAASAEGAFASWEQRYPAVQELSQLHEFFKPFMLTLGGEIKHTATWKKFFLSMGSALLSMVDVATDVATIKYYNSIGKHETADLMTSCVVISMSLSLALCVAIHHRNKRTMLIEMLGTVTFTKPAFNKFRVLINSEVEAHAVVPPVTEMVMFKMCEVFSESIPMSVIQVVNVLESKEIDWIVLGALFCSAVFVAETMGYMTFMADINDAHRKTEKTFYGFVPLHGVRLMVVKWSMYLLSFCQLLGKSLEVAVLYIVGGGWLVGLTCGLEVSGGVLGSELNKN
jgi:hypothetical protein